MRNVNIHITKVYIATDCLLIISDLSDKIKWHIFQAVAV